MVYKEKTAVDLVREYYGTVVVKVYEFLVFRGKSSLKIINQSIEDLTLKEIKSCLYVLIQHNLVYYEEFCSSVDDKNEKGELITDAVYEANINNAIHRIRVPKFINYLKQSGREEACIILEELIDHGRLTMETAISQAVAFYSSQMETIDSQAATKKFEDIFMSLIVDQFIVRVAKPKVKTDNEVSHNISKEVKNSTVSKANPSTTSTMPTTITSIGSNTISAMDVDSPNKKKTTTAKKPAATKKRTLPEPTSIHMVHDTGSLDINSHITDPITQPTKKSRNQMNVIITPEEQQQKIMNDEKKVLWTVNYNQFILEFKLKACYDFVVQKNNVNCGLLFNSMVGLCKRSIQGRDTDITIVYGEQVLSEFNSSLDEANQMSKLDFERYISVMQASRPSIVTKMASKSRQSTASDLGAFQVNINSIVNALKQKLVESIIRQKYGEQGMRVFKLLLMKKFLEVKSISEMAMIPPKECKKLLFQMLSANILRLQEIPKSSDHFANRTFYLFYVDYHALLETFTESVFKSIYNTRVRLDSELAPHREIIEKLMTNVEHSDLTEDQTKIGKKIQKLTETLETVILNLDNDLLYLNDF